MKTWLKAVLWIIAVGFVLMLGAGLVLRSFVNGAEKDRLIASVSQRIGVPVSLSAVEFDWAQWFRLRPAVSLDDVTVGNPPGFATKNMLQASRVSAQVALLPLFKKRLEIQSIRVDQPRIDIETDAHGMTNVETFIKKLSGGSKSSATADSSSGSAIASYAVEEFALTSGTFNYSGPENISLHNVDLDVHDFSLDSPCHLTESATLFNGKASSFKVEGQLGPFTPTSLPLDGTLSLTVAPAELPAAMRREQFGVMLATPGSSARASITANIKGDVYGTVSGPATLVLTNIMIGGHQDHLLALSGRAPANISAASFLSSPQFGLRIPNASLQLGKGQWAGSANFTMHGQAMSGGTQGSIRNIDINEFLSSFTSSSGKVYGSLAMPTSALEFSGRNSADILSSLKGSAKISVTQGRLGALDLPATLQRALGTQQAADGSKGTTQFTSLSGDVNIAQAKMNIENLLLDAPGLHLTGSGVIGFDESINFSIVARLKEGGLAKVLDADVPLLVTGTVDAPKVHPQVGKMVKSDVHAAVKDVLGGFLKKKPK
ncbi:MAG: AsmA family protein [Bryobacteraceae bacterium]|jgi:uncharacterized protein involved in outer membrane biogenesis